jgi:hypothetical protein
MTDGSSLSVSVSAELALTVDQNQRRCRPAGSTGKGVEEGKDAAVCHCNSERKRSSNGECKYKSS